MKNQISLSVVVCFIYSLALAQNIVVEDSLVQDPQVRIAHILQHLDQSQLNPPNLWDEGMDLIDFSAFDGLDHIDVVSDPRIFGLAYGAVMSMPTNAANQLSDPLTAYSTEMQTLGSNDVVPIMALHHTYNRIKPTAIDDGILYVDGDQLKETFGNTVSPFETITSFMATPMKRVIHAQDISFVVKSQHHFGNTGKTISSAQVDFGTGAGWQTLSLNTPLNVTFPTPGEKTLKIKYVFTDNSSMENRAKIEVVFTPVVPGQPLNGSFANVHTTSNPNNGSQVDIYVDYNCDSDGLRRPLIFVEGFNPPELGEDANQDYNELDKLDFDISPGQNLLDLIDSEGYDLIYIDYHDGGDYIQHNAAAVREAINWINEQKHDNGSYEANVLIGSSMGGLVGKYALRSMELAGEDHETELFVAMDSPMRGANIPLSVQYAARHVPNINAYFSTEFGDLVPEMRLGEQLLNRPAAKQMLIYQCENDVEGGQAGLYTSFMTEFHGLGDLQDAREIAVTNGSQLQAGQPYGAHTKYFAATAFTWWEGLISNYLGNTFLEIDLWALPHYPNGLKKIYKGNYFKTILGIIPVGLSLKNVEVSNTPGYDTAPGGHYNFSDVSSAYNGFVNGVPTILSVVLGVDLNTIDEETFCFIPAVSAVAIDDVTDINKNISDNLLRVTDGTTDFKNYIGETQADVSGFSNHLHENVTERNARLMRFEMTGLNISPPSALSSDFNFGNAQRDGVNFLTADYFRTNNRITRDITVTNAELSVNKTGLALLM